MTSIESLRKISFLSPLNEDEINQLKKVSFFKSFKKNEIIISEYSYNRGIPIILKGIIKILLVNNADEKEALLYYLKEGDTCSTSISSGIFHEKMELKVVADSDCEILFMPIDYFKDNLRNHPEIFEILLRNYFNLFHHLVNSVANIAFNPLDKRLYELLKYKAKIFDNNIIAITHEELAKELSTSREIITRILKVMEEDNKVVLKRGSIELVTNITKK